LLLRSRKLNFQQINLQNEKNAMLEFEIIFVLLHFLDDNKRSFLNKWIKAVKKLFFSIRQKGKHIKTQLLDRI